MDSKKILKFYIWKLQFLGILVQVKKTKKYNFVMKKFQIRKIQD